MTAQPHPTGGPLRTSGGVGLMIHFVEYSQEKDYPVPPRSVIMTIVNGHLDNEDFRSRARLAAEALATLLSS